MTISEQTTVGDLAATIPSSVRVFERYGLDFCCGGQKSLAVACAEAGASPDEIAHEIQEEAADTSVDARNWQEEPTGRILDYIVSTYHEPLRAELPHLQALAGKVVRAHGSKSPIFARVQQIVDDLAFDLLAHMMKEEVVLFPAIRRVSAGLPVAQPLAVPIAVMESEHDEAGANLRELRAITGGYAAPPWACATLRALYTQLERFEQAMHVHVHLENNVVFPRVIGAAAVQR